MNEYINIFYLYISIYVLYISIYIYIFFLIEFEELGPNALEQGELGPRRQLEVGKGNLRGHPVP